MHDRGTNIGIDFRSGQCARSRRIETFRCDRHRRNRCGRRGRRRRGCVGGCRSAGRVMVGTGVASSRGVGVGLGIGVGVVVAGVDTGEGVSDVESSVVAVGVGVSVGDGVGVSDSAWGFLPPRWWVRSDRWCRCRGRSVTDRRRLWHPRWSRGRESREESASVSASVLLSVPG